jgi:serine/threonine protein kinase
MEKARNEETSKSSKYDIREAKTMDFKPEETPSVSSVGLDRIGVFKILRILGEGGMGRVYLAEQDAPMKRKVALKILSKAENSKTAVRFFRREQASLALMNHPGIAKAYEAGLTPYGKPYFAMEYIEGQHITDYCNEHQLSLEERIDLFLKVCDSTQHAHQKGVIHRDIKPSNVLVKHDPQNPRPVLIDFGIARALTTAESYSGQLNTETIFGTPAYMCPEQAKGEHLDVRADIYSLSMLLYHLLTGCLPFEKKTTSGGIYGLLSAVVDGKIPAPSQLLSERENAASLAKLRGTTDSKFIKALKGDLDAIIMKGLDKDLDSRYGSVNELINDLKAYKEHRPLSIRQSRLKLFGNFYRRHRSGVVIATTFVVLFLGAFFTTVSALRMTEEARSHAEHQAEISEKMSDFLLELYKLADPFESGEKITARQMLDRGARQVYDEFEDEPLLQASLMEVIGEAYFNLTLNEEAAPLYKKALKNLEQHKGPSPELAKVLELLGRLETSRGEFLEAEKYLKRSLSIREDIFGPDHLETAASMDSLGVLYFDWARYDQSAELFTKALEIREAALDEHPDVAQTLNGLGISIALRDSMTAALPILERALAMRQRILPKNHPELGQSLNNLALIYIDEDRDKAMKYLQEAKGIWLAVLGPDSFRLGIVQLNLGDLYRNKDMYEEAEDALLDAYRIFKGAFPGVNARHAEITKPLGDLYRDMGNLEKCLHFYRETANIREVVLGKDKQPTLDAVTDLISLLEQLGKEEEASQWRTRYADGFRESKN